MKAMKISTNFPLSFIILTLKRVLQINRNQSGLMLIGAVVFMVMMAMNPGKGLAQTPSQAMVI